MRNLPVVITLGVTLITFWWGAPAPGQSPASGLRPGEFVVPWNPVHVAGPDRGTTACPVCTYQERPAVLIFVRDGEDAAELARRLQTLVNTFRKRELKGFVVVLDSTPERLKRMARELGIAEIALCYPEPETRAEALREYRIHPAAKNTVLVYKDYVVAASFTDLDAKDFGRVAAVVRKTLR